MNEKVDFRKVTVQEVAQGWKCSHAIKEEIVLDLEAAGYPATEVPWGTFWQISNLIFKLISHTKTKRNYALHRG